MIDIPQASYESFEVAYAAGDQMWQASPREIAEMALEAGFPAALAAAYTELADQLTELAEHIRQRDGFYVEAQVKAAGLVEGITVIRERAARLGGSS